MQHFEEIKPEISGYEVTKHFKRDLKDSSLGMVMTVLNSGYSEELHKFEFKKKDRMYFRAKIEGYHILYCFHDGIVTFLRAFKDFNDYTRFLEEV